MVFLINCSNLKQGGGLQVADSVCRELCHFTQHRFIVVLSSFFTDTFGAIKGYQNVEVFQYDVRNNFSTIIFGRNTFLDNLVKKKKVDAVLTIFGPSRWNPKCKHLCGFARAQLLLENPKEKNKPLKIRFVYCVWKWAFKRSSDTFYTENDYISKMLPRLLGKVKVYTVTNYYNQVFDNPNQWLKKKLPDFEGTTMLTLSNSYPHKNLEIAADISRILIKMHPGFQFRFVFSIDRDQFHKDIDGIEDHFLFLGKVNVAECPSLYEQCNIAFQPSLQECFTATYPEAMRMERPIVTTDLEFAHGLCSEAACYYSAIEAQAAANAIYKVATDITYATRLVLNGKKQLANYDTYSQRSEKLVKILESIVIGDGI